jgi:hypothetical protein
MSAGRIMWPALTPRGLAGSSSEAYTPLNVCSDFRRSRTRPPAGRSIRTGSNSNGSTGYPMPATRAAARRFSRFSRAARVLVRNCPPPCRCGVSSLDPSAFAEDASFHSACRARGVAAAACLRVLAREVARFWRDGHAHGRHPFARDAAAVADPGGDHGRDPRPFGIPCVAGSRSSCLT